MNCTGSGEATFRIGDQTGCCCEIDLWHTLWSPTAEAVQVLRNADASGVGDDVPDWSLEMVEELAIASGMTDPGGPLPDAEVWAGRQHRLFLDEFAEYIDPEIVSELEWDECCEPSYFTVYDQTGHEGIDGERMVVNAVGEPVLHDAVRHEQECALNAYANQWIGGPHTITWRDEFSVSNVECKIVATGDKFSVATSRFGAAFVPKSCENYIPGIGETFWTTLDSSFGKMREGGAKYPLRVRSGSICY
jgi:hypothetical protein